MNFDEIIKKMKAAVEGVRKAIYGVEVREYIAQGLENVLAVGQVTVDSAKAAKASEDAAKASEDAAKTSETNAKGSETAAAASRDEAELIKGTQRTAPMRRQTVRPRPKRAKRPQRNTPAMRRPLPTPTRLSRWQTRPRTLRPPVCASNCWRWCMART